MSGNVPAWPRWLRHGPTGTVAVWAAATAAALFFAWQTRVGPSVAITDRHGLHVGDVLAFVVCWTGAVLASVRFRLRPRTDAEVSRPSPPSGAR